MSGQTKPKGSGRKKGTPNKKTLDILELLHSQNICIPTTILNLLPELAPEKQADVLLTLMNYLYPKRKSIEYSTSESTEPEKFEIVFVGAKDGKPA